MLRRKGRHRRDDGRRRERRAGAQARRHRHRDGDHRHRGLEGGRGDDPHRRQLRHDRRGRRARPRPLRQPDEVHPLPDGRARSASSSPSSAPPSATSSAASPSSRSRRCGSTSRRRCSRRSGSATASRPKGLMAAEAARPGRTDPAALEAALARVRRRRHGRHDDRRSRLGRRPLQLDGRAHDGDDLVRDREPALLVLRARRAAVGLQPRRPRATASSSCSPGPR